MYVFFLIRRRPPSSTSTDHSFHTRRSSDLDDREHRLGRIGEHAALDPLQQPVGLIAGKIRLEAQAARAGLLAQRLGLVALGIVVGESRVLVLVQIGRASLRGSVGQYVLIRGVAVSFTKKKTQVELRNRK